MSGALQALITPALFFAFPHLMFFFFFAEHSIVILTAMYFVFVENFKPSLRSLFRALLYFNFTGLLVLMVDLLLKSNYMFLLAKPESASLFDLLGPWPLYLVLCEAVAFISFFILYLPFLRLRVNKK